jgi:hypothetical protein
VSRRAPLSVAIRLVSLLVCGSCIDLSVDPDEVIAIEFPPLPSPSVVAGDTLRDESGRAVALTVRLFDASGAEVSGPAVEFLTRDTLVTIVGGNFLVARATADGSTSLFASAAGLQSPVRQIEVVKQPDSLAASGPLDTLRLALPDDARANTSAPVAVRVLRDDALLGVVGVRSWIVSFSLEHNGASVPPGDTSLVFLVDDTGRPTVADTTDGQGTASRRVRYRALPGNVPQLDSVSITASARYRGAPLAGGPVRLVLPVKPRA